MKRSWLLSPFIFLALPLFGQELNDPFERSEIARRSVFGQSQKTQQRRAADNSASSSTLDTNYRLGSDFVGTNSFVEYLIWQTQEEASDFVITPNAHSTIDRSYPNTEGLGNIQSASFNWNSGVRVGLGYTFARDHWQALGQYTWYETEGHNGFSITTPITSATTQFLMPTFYSQSTRGIEAASNSVHFSYQMADLLAVRKFMPTDQIKFVFSFGATGGYIKEDFLATYLNVNNTYVHNNWAFGGGGFRAGLDSNWHFGYGFGLFGRASFAALLGQYTNFGEITADSPAVTKDGLAVPTLVEKYTLQNVLLVPATQIALGFDWCRAFEDSWISAVNIAVAGEFNYLTNLQQVYKSSFHGTTVDKAPPLRNFSAVYMYGATARLSADF